MSTPHHLRAPGTTERITARRALVIAPHYDDEVIGCGGLLRQLSRSGTKVHVIFATDGRRTARPGSDDDDGGAPPRLPGAPLSAKTRVKLEAFSRRREEESSCAGAILGVRSYEQIGIPDGELELHRSTLGAAIERTLTERDDYDLVLAPSPLEISADHRAAFAATFDALSSPTMADAQARILLYEVNHPLYPNLLVDVSEEERDIERALSCFKSQQSQHDYRRAAMALRRYRTLTLDPEVTAAEAYRRLDIQDVTTRSLAQLIRHVGGLPELSEIESGPEVSLVMRTKDRPRKRTQALESVAASTYRRVELVLVNDGGAPVVIPNDFPFPVTSVVLPKTEGRAAAAQKGVEAARGDYLSFLDDDDLAAPEHLGALVSALAHTSVPVVYSDAAVGSYVRDPELGWRCRERSLPYRRDFDPDLLLVDNYIPFITLLIDRTLFRTVGPFDESLPFFEDWDYLIRLSRQVDFQHLRRVTCEYRQFEGERAGAHALAGEPWKRSDFVSMKGRVIEKHADHLSAERLARAIQTLRFEAVQAGTEVHETKRELETLRQSYAALEERYHRLNGRVRVLESRARRDATREVRGGSEPPSEPKDPGPSQPWDISSSTETAGSMGRSQRKNRERNSASSPK